jgi:hemerythrin-like domain-containing protein
MSATAILKDEHRSIERMLNVLETTSSRLKEGRDVSPRIFRDALKFIKQFADGCHHHKEEILLFPTMIEKGFLREAGPIAVMLSEHDIGRAHVRSMLEAVEKYEHGDKTGASQLTSSADAFIGLLRQHILKEDNVLFPMADQHFSEADQTKLLAQFEDVDRSGEACCMKTELLNLLQGLEGEVARTMR